jgi:hypothetical protein
MTAIAIAIRKKLNRAEVQYFHMIYDFRLRARWFFHPVVKFIDRSIGEFCLICRSIFGFRQLLLISSVQNEVVA